MKLFEIVKKYLETNGISIRYFSDCIGVSPNVGGKWLRGDIKKLPAEKMEKIYDLSKSSCCTIMLGFDISPYKWNLF